MGIYDRESTMMMRDLATPPTKVLLLWLLLETCYGICVNNFTILEHVSQDDWLFTSLSNGKKNLKSLRVQLLLFHFRSLEAHHTWYVEDGSSGEMWQDCHVDQPYRRTKCTVLLHAYKSLLYWSNGVQLICSQCHPMNDMRPQLASILHFCMAVTLNS